MKVKTKEDSQKTGKPCGVYLKFGHKLYKRQEMHIGQNLIFCSLFFGVTLGMLNNAYISTMKHFLPGIASTSLPYIIYHVLCFIGDYPLCFFKANWYMHPRYHEAISKNRKFGTNFNNDRPHTIHPSTQNWLYYDHHVGPNSYYRRN